MFLALQSAVHPEEAATYRRVPKPEDPLQLQAHLRMEEIAERFERLEQEAEGVQLRPEGPSLDG